MLHKIWAVYHLITTLNTTLIYRSAYLANWLIALESLDGFFSAFRSKRNPLDVFCLVCVSSCFFQSIVRGSSLVARFFSISRPSSNPKWRVYWVPCSSLGFRSTCALKPERLKKTNPNYAGIDPVLKWMPVTFSVTPGTGCQVKAESLNSIFFWVWNDPE